MRPLGGSLVTVRVRRVRHGTCIEHSVMAFSTCLAYIQNRVGVERICSIGRHSLCAHT